MNVPKLRFKEFNDEWQNYKVEDILKISNGINKEKEFFGSGTPIINYMDVNKNELISHNIVKGLVIANSKELETFNVKKGDILFTRTSETSDEIGLSSSVIENIDKCIFSGFILKGTQTKQFIHPYFGGYYFRNPKMRKEIIKHSSITTRALTSGSLLSQMSISIPTIIEQEKIGKTLSLLDKKIELQTKKIEDLKLFKLYMENQFIFKDDASYIEYKLRDILIEGNKTPVADTSKYQKLTIKLNLKGLEFNESQKEMSDKRPFYVRDENELIIGKQNYFNGSIAIVNKKYAGGICSNAIMSFKAKDGFDIKYIYLYLSQKSYMKQREFLANGTGQKELSEKEFLNFSIRIPTDNKVKKIIKNVNCISKKILLEENKLNKLIELKKGLMQNMFV